MISYFINENLINSIPCNFILHFGINLVFLVFASYGKCWEKNEHLLCGSLKNIKKKKKGKRRNNVVSAIPLFSVNAS